MCYHICLYTRHPTCTVYAIGLLWFYFYLCFHFSSLLHKRHLYSENLKIFIYISYVVRTNNLDLTLRKLLLLRNMCKHKSFICIETLIDFSSAYWDLDLGCLECCESALFNLKNLLLMNWIADKFEISNDFSVRWCGERANSLADSFRAELNYRLSFSKKSIASFKIFDSHTWIFNKF